MSTSRAPPQSPASNLTSNATAPGTPAANSMMVINAINRAVSIETVKYVLTVQGVLFLIALVATLPLIYVYIVSGRFKSGALLKSGKRSLETSQAWSVPPNGKVFEGQHPPSGSAFVYYRRLYNVTLLRMVPVVNLTIGQILVLLIFSGLAIFGQFYKNLEAPASNFKRPGWVAISSVPLLFLLAMKNTPFGLLGKGYERVNFIHRFVGRIIILAGFVHGGLWLQLKLKSNQPVVFKGHSLTGLIALVAFLMIFLSSLKPFRTRFYQTFITLHVLGYITVLVALWFHVKSLRPFVGVAIGAVVFDVLLGLMMKTHLCSAVLTSVPGEMTRIEVSRLNDGWRAGQHVYLRVLHGMKALEKHPFTIVNAPCSVSPSTDEQSLMLVAKSAGDFTKSLHSLGRSNANPTEYEDEKGGPDDKEFMYSETSQEKKHLTVAIEGPYGGFYTDLCRHETVVLIAGGSGFTYCSATLEDIVGCHLKASTVTSRIYVIWSVRDLGMAQSFAPKINELIELARRANLELAVRLHVTTSLQTIYNPIQFSEVVQERPDMSSIIRDALGCTVSAIERRGGSRGSGLAVGICGPMPMIASLRNAVADADQNLASKAGGISVHSELFGW